jgi:hypothetical protein
MAQVAGTYSSYDAKGIREDLVDFIYNVDPVETPVLTMIPKTKASNTLHEWQTDTLAAAAQNAVIEGDESTFSSPSATTRLTNYCQIAKKTALVTGTLEAVNKAGRNKEMAYQLVKRGKEMKRDMEFDICANNAKNVGTDTRARELAGLESWIVTNIDEAGDATVATGDGTDARSDGTQRVFKESQLKTALAAAWDAGGNPDCVVVGSFNKQKISGFTGGATRMDKAEDKKLYASIDVYVSDFGDLDIVPNRFSRSRSALILQKDMWAVAFLRNMKTEELAKTGDAEKRQIICEYTLEARNEKSSGAVYDLTTS